MYEALYPTTGEFWMYYDPATGRTFEAHPSDFEDSQHDNSQFPNVQP